MAVVLFGADSELIKVGELASQQLGHGHDSIATYHLAGSRRSCTRNVHDVATGQDGHSDPIGYVGQVAMERLRVQVGVEQVEAGRGTRTDGTKTDVGTVGGFGWEDST